MASLPRALGAVVASAERAAAGGAGVRVRYAPSPTGNLHLGGLRTALYNYLLARATGGAFVLRIEDTDRARLVPGAVAALVDDLRWCGLAHDEGPVVSAGGEVVGSTGAYGPYVQSERLPTYRAAADELLASGAAYRCFCTPARLAQLREAQAAAGLPSLYDRACAHVPLRDAAARAAAGEAHVVRMRVPDVPGGFTTVPDVVLGDVRMAHAGIDDQVLLKTDGFPTYHLAAVVDDHAMCISHVVRGQEWLPSTPKHLLLHAALGWAPPAYAHLPLLLNADRGKLSKRHGHASVADFRTAGYDPAALLNFVALLGWTPPAPAASPSSSLPTAAPGARGGAFKASPTKAGAHEVLSLADMVATFSLAGVHKANAVVDRARLDYFNGEHLRRLFRAARAAAAAGDDTAAAAGSVAPGAGIARDVPADLVVADTPALRALRESVLSALDAVLATLRPPGAAVPPVLVAMRAPVALLNAALVAQHERVHLSADFVPLLLPFVADSGEFAAWVSRGLEAAAAGTGNMAKLAATGGGGGDAAGAGAAAVEFPRRRLSALLSHLAPALRDVADRWDAMGDAGFGASGGAAAVDAAKAVAAARGVPPPSLLLPLRFALTGQDVGATLSVTAALLGRDTCVRRLRALADATVADEPQPLS